MKKHELEEALHNEEMKAMRLERCLDVAINELLELAQEVGVKPDWFVPCETKHDNMAHKAALAVKKIYDMRNARL